MKYFQEKAETMPAEQIRKLQSEKLVRQVRHVYEHVAPYRKKMDELGVKPEDIHGVEDLHRLPFLTKSDLRDEYPKGFLAVPQKDYSLFTRMSLIAESLKRAGKPIFSSEIDIDGLCSNQLKQWTLKRMMRIGVIGRRLAFKTRTGYCVYRYFLKQETKETNK